MSDDRNPDYDKLLKDLVAEHPDVGFMFNPGGGEFFSVYRGRCQVAVMPGSEKDDYEKVKEWLERTARIYAEKHAKMTRT